MDDEKLSDREKALLAEARREAAALKAAPSGAAPSPPARKIPAAEAKTAPTAAERLAELMEQERAETQEKKRKMRRYGITISSSILGLFALWAVWSLRRRR